MTNLEPIIYEMKTWPGQIMGYTMDTEFLPPKICFQHAVNNEPSVELDHIRVFGQIWDIEFNTGFWFGKAFKDMKSAKKFFNAFKKKYPDSKITIQKEKKEITMQYR